MSGGVERLAGRAAADWRARIAERLRGVSGIAVEVNRDGVVASGRRLRARWLADARLRWIGGWS